LKQKEQTMFSPKTTYKIIRMRADGDHRVIRRGLTLEEAKAHCSSPKTHGEGWFDGYEFETDQEQCRRARRRR
jgi:hypothetical protein